MQSNWFGGDDEAFVDKIGSDGALNEIQARNRFSVRAGDAFGNIVSRSGEVDGFSVLISSLLVEHNASVQVTDLSEGYYGIEFNTTIAGW